jgi:translation elongation factor EF-Tu-like GTPase
MVLSFRHRGFTAVALGLAGAAQAAPGDLVFAVHSPIPAQLTLLKEQGAVGRSNPFYKGYRPSFFFSGKSDVMCAVQLPDGQDKVDPGETVDVSLDCIDSIAVKTGKPGFIFKEGGRTVGEGKLTLPTP